MIAKIRDLGYDLDERLLRQIGTFLMLTQSFDAKMQGVGDKRPIPPGNDTRLVREVLYKNEPKWNATLPFMVAYLRKRVLIKRYHMQPDKMLEMMETFGPIDWRHASAHGMYWAKLGTEQADKLRNNAAVDIINTYRQNVHSMQQLTRFGRIAFEPFSKRLQMLPDIRFIPAYEIAVEEADEAHFKKYGVHSDSYRSGHENFLLAAIVYQYLYGNTQEAGHYFNKVRKLYGNDPHNLNSQRYTSTLEDLVIYELQDNASMMDRSTQFIDAMIRQGLEQGLLYGKLNTFNRCIKLAKKMHTKFQKRGITNTIAPQDRMKILPWRQTLTESYISYMKQQSVDPLVRARIWRNTPNFLQIDSYDRLMPFVQEQFPKYGLDTNLAFPIPQGMAKIREQGGLLKDGEQVKKTETNVERQ
ncbi:MAG: hypothetical protein JKX85_11040 [Phycisphaeraceae bacterium]|nr:hypothetical protein [Phycisphaeraceae bacterium]